MSQKVLIEKADERSRQRPLVITIFVVMFVVLSVFSGPLSVAADDPAAQSYARNWAISAILLFGILATGGGLFRRSEFRTLVNDEVWRAHRATAASVGYWTAMAVAFGIYLAPALDGLTARGTVYVVVTPSVALALLTLAWLERRAHRGA